MYIKKLAFVCLFAPIVAKAEIDINASVTFQSRYFHEENTSGLEPDVYQSFSFTPEFLWVSKSTDHQLKGKAFTRYGNDERDRNHSDIQEFIWSWHQKRHGLQVGIGKVFWGVTESLHLVDIINQTDTLEGVDGEDKLGQPMVNYSYVFDDASVEFFVLPYFREREFLDNNSRFGLPFKTKSTRLKTVYQSSAEENHVDTALRLSFYEQIGSESLDLTFSYFKGTSRVPDITFDGSANRVIAFYDQIEQFGTTSILTFKNCLLKNESIYVKPTSKSDYYASVLGAECTKVGLFGSRYDLGYIVEWQFDKRDELESINQNDIFLGLRFSFNDFDNSEIIAGVIQDLDQSDFQSFRIEGNMRIADRVRLDIEYMGFSGSEPVNISSSLSNEDFLQIELKLFF